MLEGKGKHTLEKANKLGYDTELGILQKRTPSNCDPL